MIVVKWLATFLERELRPDFLDIDAAVSAYLDDVTGKIAPEEAHGGICEAEEVAEPRAITS